ncbi:MULTISPECIES: hypothetical protein [unclassified Kitasatospora]
MTRVVPAVVLGASVLLLSACGSSGSSSSSNTAAPSSAAPTAAVPTAVTSSAATSAPADAPTPAVPSKTADAAGGSAGGAAGSGGANTVTITGSEGGTFTFDTAGCVGKKSPSGPLTLSATGKSTKKAALVMGFDGQGQMSLLLTVGEPEDPKVAAWAGKVPVGAGAGRTEDAITFSGMAVHQMPGGIDATASGTLKCGSADALF